MERVDGSKPNAEQLHVSEGKQNKTRGKVEAGRGCSRPSCLDAVSDDDDARFPLGAYPGRIRLRRSPSPGRPRTFSGLPCRRTGGFRSGADSQVANRSNSRKKLYFRGIERHTSCSRPVSCRPHQPSVFRLASRDLNGTSTRHLSPHRT